MLIVADASFCSCTFESTFIMWLRVSSLIINVNHCHQRIKDLNNYCFIIDHIISRRPINSTVCNVCNSSCLFGTFPSSFRCLPYHFMSIIVIFFYQAHRSLFDYFLKYAHFIDEKTLIILMKGISFFVNVSFLLPDTHLFLPICSRPIRNNNNIL